MALLSQPVRRRILVIRGGAIGDFVLTLPVLAALRRAFPQCPLEILGYPHIVSLAIASSLVDAVRPIEARALAGFFARGGGLDPGLSAYFAECALILSFLYDPDRIFQDNVARQSRAQFIVGPHRPDEAQGRHATAAFLEPLQRLAIFDADPIPRLPPRATGFAASHARPGQPLVALHPGSGSERKNWPECRWAELMGRLFDSGQMELLLIGGEAEGERLARLTAAYPGRPWQVARNLPLVELADRMRECRAFVGHDSGITHLAAAIGLPGLVLWGPSNERVWRPRSDALVLLQAADGLPQLSSSTVAASLMNLLAVEQEAEQVE